jgi:anti-sigma-K factor RskA
MSEPHESLVVLAPGFALGTLDSTEHRAFAAHLGECPVCSAEVAILSRTAAALAYAVPQVTPRPELRRRILRAVGALDTDVIAPRPRRRTAVAMTWLPAAALLVLALALGAYVVSLRSEVGDLESRLDQATSRMLLADRALDEARRVALQTRSTVDVLTAPDLARIDLAGQATAPSARARALWSRQRGMVFTASDLPPLPAGRIYQVWVVTASARVSAGLIEPDASGRSTAVLATPSDIDPPVAVAVTLEPAGGVAQPTGAFYLLGTPRS